MPKVLLKDIDPREQKQIAAAENAIARGIRNSPQKPAKPFSDATPNARKCVARCAARKKPSAGTNPWAAVSGSSSAPSRSPENLPSQRPTRKQRWNTPKNVGEKSFRHSREQTSRRCRRNARAVGHRCPRLRRNRRRRTQDRKLQTARQRLHERQ